jgi:hypothetical protein
LDLGESALGVFELDLEQQTLNYAAKTDSTIGATYDIGSNEVRNFYWEDHPSNQVLVLDSWKIDIEQLPGSHSMWLCCDWLGVFNGHFYGLIGTDSKAMTSRLIFFSEETKIKEHFFTPGLIGMQPTSRALYFVSDSLYYLGVFCYRRFEPDQDTKR